MAELHSALVFVLGVTGAIAPNSAAASDFWDNVRAPGLGAYRLHLRLAAAAFAGNRSDVALQEADVAIQKCADCEAAHVMRGRALIAVGRNGEALSAFEHALALDANALSQAADARAAARSAINVGKPELGVAVLRRLLERSDDPRGDPLAQIMLADALQAVGPATLRNAIVAYREAIEDDASAAQAVLGLALALHRSGDVAQGLALLRRTGPQAGLGTAGGWLSGPERAARVGLWLTAIDDLPAARDAWLRAADGGGPWCDHARATLGSIPTTANGP
jgi:tetratricopeptide (TPR) repeat protein